MKETNQYDTLIRKWSICYSCLAISEFNKVWVTGYKIAISVQVHVSHSKYMGA